MGDSLLLTIGALMLVILFSIGANFLITDNVNASQETEYDLTALSLAESVIDEAKTKAFDQTMVVSQSQSLSQLTPPESLGPEPGETLAGPDSISPSGYHSSTLFNDIDDYNGYVRIIDTPRAGGYRVSVAVDYVSPTWPDSVVTTKTFCKRMVAVVTSPLMSRPLILRYAFTF